MIPGTNRPRVRHGRRVAEALAAIAALAALTGTAGTAGAAPTADLADRLAQAGPGDRIAVIATLRATRSTPGRFDGRPAALLRALRRTAAGDAAGVAAEVDGPVRAFWLVNAAAFTGTPDEIRAVAADPAVASVDLDTPGAGRRRGRRRRPHALPGRRAAATGAWTPSTRRPRGRRSACAATAC